MTCLEPDEGQMREMVNAAMDRIVEHILSLPIQAAADTEGAVELAKSLREPMPETGQDLQSLLGLLFEQAVPKSFNTASPGYLAYIPGGGLFHSAVADLVADAVNRYVGVGAAAPALVQIESNVIRWFCDMIGYQERAGGILTTGGSLANFTAVVTARRDRLSENFLSGTIYASSQVHHSVQKAAALAGFPAANVRSVGVDRLYRIDLRELADTVASDRAEGWTPFLVVGSAGTTNTGAVDDLDQLSELCDRENLWLHIDAAYGGFFMMTERGRRVMSRIERADSITLDPHKGIFLPYGTGCLLVRDREALRRAHAATADYMPQMQRGTEIEDFCELSPELSRDFRGLRVWLPMKMCGVPAFRAQLDEKLDLAQWITEELREIEDMEIIAEPQLSIVAFRLAPREIDPSEWNLLNRNIMEGVNRRKRVYLTGTKLDGCFVIRICVLSFRTHRERLEMALEDLRVEVEIALRRSMR